MGVNPEKSHSQSTKIKSWMEKFVLLMIRISRGLSQNMSFLIMKNSCRYRPRIPALIPITLNSSVAVGRIELKVVRIGDGNHVASTGCYNCFKRRLGDEERGPYMFE